MVFRSDHPHGLSGSAFSAAPIELLPRGGELVLLKAPLVTTNHALRELRLGVRSVVQACLALILVMEGIACGGDSHAPTGPPDNQDCTSPVCNVSSVTVSPTIATVYEGLSIQFRATARDASGRVVTGVTFQWEVSDPAVAEIDASGRLTGRAAGQVQVRAIANGKVGSVDLVVIDATVASLEISLSQASLLVNESALLRVTARNADRVVIPTPPQLQLASSDEAIARVNILRVVTGLRRGTATITASTEGVSAAVSLTVKARVRITPNDQPDDNQVVWYMAIGEARQFTASFVDVNGVRIDEEPSLVTWFSSHPGAVSVSSTGLVRGLQWVGGENLCDPDFGDSFPCTAVISASTSDGAGTTMVHVPNVVAGLPATVRFVHAAGGFGPLAFVANGGAPVTLEFGESREQPISSGRFQVRTVPASTLNNSPSALIRGGDYLSVYVVEAYFGLYIITAFPEDVSVAADSGLVRFIGAGGMKIIDLQPPGALMSTNPEECYFDGGYTGYHSRPAGEFDVIFARDLGDPVWRTSARVEPGRKLTFVIAGTNPETWNLRAYPDP